MKVDGKKQEMARGRKMEGWPRSGELQPIGQRKQERGRRSCQLAVQLAETRTGPAQLRRGLGRSGSLSTNGACQLDLVCHEFARQPASACRFESPGMALRFENVVRRSRTIPSIEQVASRKETRQEFVRRVHVGHRS